MFSSPLRLRTLMIGFMFFDVLVFMLLLLFRFLEVISTIQHMITFHVE